MQNNYITDYIESKGFTVQECRRPAKKEVPANMRHRYSSYEEYQEALHDFLNGMWCKLLTSFAVLVSISSQQFPTQNNLNSSKS